MRRCPIRTPAGLGVETWSRGDYLAALESLRELPATPGNWRERFGEWPASALAAA